MNQQLMRPRRHVGICWISIANPRPAHSGDAEVQPPADAGALPDGGPGSGPEPRSPGQGLAEVPPDGTSAVTAPTSYSGRGPLSVTRMLRRASPASFLVVRRKV